MASIATTKLNNAEVQPVQLPTHGNENIAGADFIPTLYSNIFACAKKKSGKTFVIYNLLEALTNNIHKHPRAHPTAVYFFVSTIDKDPVYARMLDMLTARGIEYEKYTELDPDAIQEKLHADLPESNAQRTRTIETRRVTPSGQLIIHTETITTASSKLKRTGPLAAERIFVFDDLGAELRHPAIAQLLKTNRHFKATIIISSQYLTDLMPAAIKQLDYMLLFRSFNEEKLKKIYESLDLAIDFEDFVRLYKYATDEPYSFLYIDARKDKYRKRFDVGLELPAHDAA